MKKIFTFLFLSTSWLISDDNPNTRGSVDDYTQLKYKVAMVTRTSVPPVVDGIIDDLSWDDAIVIDEFLQFDRHLQSQMASMDYEAVSMVAVEYLL